MANNHGRFVARAGALLFLISLINGFLVHVMPQEQQVLAAHLIGLIGSSFLLGLGALWPRLNQPLRMSKMTAFLAIYGFCGGWLINFLAAATGVFGIFPISVGVSTRSQIGDPLVSAGLLSVALALLTFGGILFWQLRAGSAKVDRSISRVSA